VAVEFEELGTFKVAEGLGFVAFPTPEVWLGVAEGTEEFPERGDEHELAAKITIVMKRKPKGRKNIFRLLERPNSSQL
jgi:hypothetical protein